MATILYRAMLKSASERQIKQLLSIIGKNEIVWLRSTQDLPIDRQREEIDSEIEVLRQAPDKESKTRLKEVDAFIMKIFLKS